MVLAWHGVSDINMFYGFTLCRLGFDARPLFSDCRCHVGRSEELLSLLTCQTRMVSCSWVWNCETMSWLSFPLEIGHLVFLRAFAVPVFSAPHPPCPRPRLPQVVAGRAKVLGVLGIAPLWRPHPV